MTFNEIVKTVNDLSLDSKAVYEETARRLMKALGEVDGLGDKIKTQFEKDEKNPYGSLFTGVYFSKWKINNGSWDAYIRRLGDDEKESRIQIYGLRIEELNQDIMAINVCGIEADMYLEVEVLDHQPMCYYTETSEFACEVGKMMFGPNFWCAEHSDEDEFLTFRFSVQEDFFD